METWGSIPFLESSSPPNCSSPTPNPSRPIFSLGNGCNPVPDLSCTTLTTQIFYCENLWQSLSNVYTGSYTYIAFFITKSGYLYDKQCYVGDKNIRTLASNMYNEVYFAECLVTNKLNISTVANLVTRGLAVTITI